MAAVLPGIMSTTKSGKKEREIPAWFILFSMKENVFPEIAQQKPVYVS